MILLCCSPLVTAHLPVVDFPGLASFQEFLRQARPCLGFAGPDGSCAAHGQVSVVIGAAPRLGKEAILAEFGRQMREVNAQQVEAVNLALPALKRLVEVCGHKTGQGYQVRALLYSAWNGQEVSLCQNLLGLDWAIKRDLCAVFLAFGCEPRGASPFFYDTIKAAFTEAGLWDWFLEAFKEDGEE